MFHELSDKPLCVWTCRAIHDGGERPIGFVPGRHGLGDQGTDDQKHDLVNWLNLHALPVLNSMFRNVPVNHGGSDEPVILREFCFEAKASNRGGYIYITAGILPVTEIGRHPNEHSGNLKDEAILLCGGVKYIWGATHAVPFIGDEGTIASNGLGAGIVYGYQDEPYGSPEEKAENFRLLNLRVKLTKRPQWSKDQGYRRYLELFAKRPDARFNKPMGKTDFYKSQDALIVCWGELLQLTKSRHLQPV